MAKKVTIVLLVLCLLITILTSCKQNDAKKTQENTDTTSASKTTSFSSSTPQITATPQVTATINSPYPSSAQTTTPLSTATSITEYSIDLDFQIKTRVAGIVFGGTDENSFLMWQVNSWSYGDDPSKELEETDKKVYLRPHMWNAGTFSVIEEKDISDVIKWEDREKKHHMKITVNASNEVKTFINDKLVYTYTDPMAAYGLFGFRETTSVAAYFDNIVIKNTLANTIIFQENFDSNTNPFPEGEIVKGVMGDSPAIFMTALTNGAGEICVIEK